MRKTGSKFTVMFHKAINRSFDHFYIQQNRTTNLNFKTKKRHVYLIEHVKHDSLIVFTGTFLLRAFFSCTVVDFQDAMNNVLTKT